MLDMTYKKGFTLIELLIVITIMGILAALISTNLFGARERAQDSQKKSNLEQLKTALHSYYANYRNFPASTNGMTIFGCGVNGTSQCTDSFTAGGVEYLNKFAKSGSFYEFRYYQCNGGDDFRLKINLTNASDPEILESQANCPANICVGQSLSFGSTDYVLCGN